MAEEESTKKTPWKNGYWYSYNERHVVQIVEGNSVKGNPHIILDFPDAKPIFTLTWTFGDFGPAKDVIAEASGRHYFYNYISFFMIFQVLCPSLKYVLKS